MVKPYCTLLVFTKENISFSKVALLSVHWSCLVGSVMITRGYRPWKTANTTADFYLLVKKTIIKTLKQKLKFVQAFFLSDIWQGGSLTQLMLITTPFKYDPKVTGSLVMRLGPKTWPSVSVGFVPENLFCRFWV